MDKFEQLKELMLCGFSITKNDQFYLEKKPTRIDPRETSWGNSFSSFNEAFKEALKNLKSTKEHEWSVLLMYNRGWGPIFENLEPILGKDYPTAKKYAEDKAIEFLEKENLIKKIRTWEVKIQPVLT